MQVISDISLKIANLREQIKTLLLKIKSKSWLNFLDKPGSFWKASKTEIEEDSKRQKEAEDKFNNKLKCLTNEISELKKRDVDYELNDEQVSIIGEIVEPKSDKYKKGGKKMPKLILK